MAATSSSAREARRRRIMDREADRLALITGRIPSLPESEPRHLHTASLPPPITRDLDFSDQIFSASPDNVDKASGPSLAEHGTGTESSKLDNSEDGSMDLPRMRKCQTSIASTSSDFKFDGEAQPSQVVPTAQNPPFSISNKEHHIESKIQHHKYFTANQIISAIAASERARIYCSLAAAFLVILSYVGFPILGSYIIKGMVLYRPLYLLLLTNITLVIGRLLVGKQAGSERSERNDSTVSPTEEKDLADQLGKALELGLVLQNIANAAFMDCSVYAVVVVCGISLAQSLGW